MKLIFPIIWSAFFLSEVLLNRIFRSGNTRSKELDKHSITFIWMTIVVSIPLGVFLSFLGLGLSFNHWLTLAVIFLPVTFSLLYRIHIEEKMLQDQFGPAYQEYIKRTKKLIPKIY